LSTIAFTVDHDADPDALRQGLDQVAAHARRHYGIHGEWEEDTLHLRGAAVSGTIQLTPGKVTVELRLGWLAAPFKGRIEGELRQQIARLTGPGSNATG
jgi:putative polyhydroxyalkanoate system protein